MPLELPRRRRHHFREPCPSEWGHRVFAFPRPLEDVAARIDLPIEVSGLTRHAELVLHLLIMRLELVEAERPILHGGSLRDSRGAIAPGRLAHDFEVPGIEAPALSPIVERRPPDGVHHWMNRRPSRVGRGGVRPMRRHFVIGLLHGLRPPADVVSQLVWCEVGGSEPGSRLETDDFESGPSERKGSHATHSAEPDDDDIGLRQTNRHGAALLPGWPSRAASSRTSRSRTPIYESVSGLDPGADHSP